MRGKMADILKRGPYRWQVRIRRKGHPSQTKTFSTKAETEAWAQMTESEMTRDVFVYQKEAENTTPFSSTMIAPSRRHHRSQRSDRNPVLWHLPLRPPHST